MSDKKLAHVGSQLAKIAKELLKPDFHSPKGKGSGKGWNESSPKKGKGGGKGGAGAKAKAKDSSAKNNKTPPIDALRCRCQPAGTAQRYCILDKLVDNPQWQCTCGFYWAHIAWESNNKRHHTTLRRVAANKGVPNPIDAYDSPPERSGGPPPAPKPAANVELTSGVSLDQHINEAVASGKSLSQAVEEASKLVKEPTPEPPKVVPPAPKPGEVSSSQRTKFSHQIDVLDNKMRSASRKLAEHTKLANGYRASLQECAAKKVDLQALLANDARMSDGEDLIQSLLSTGVDKLMPKPDDLFPAHFDGVADATERNLLENQRAVLGAQYDAFGNLWSNMACAYKQILDLQSHLAKVCAENKLEMGPTKSRKRDAEQAELSGEDAGTMAVDWMHDGPPPQGANASGADTGSVSSSASVSVDASSAPNSSDTPAAKNAGGPPKAGAMSSVISACPKPSGAIAASRGVSRIAITPSKAESKAAKKKEKADAAAVREAEISQDAEEYVQAALKTAKLESSLSGAIATEDDI